MNEHTYVPPKTMLICLDISNGMLCPVILWIFITCRKRVFDILNHSCKLEHVIYVPRDSKRLLVIERHANTKIDADRSNMLIC